MVTNNEINPESQTVSDADRTLPGAGRVLPTMSFWGANLFLLAYFGVLAGGFIVQFGLHEYPCPLCMLQRYSMMLACLGPLYIIVRTRRGSVTISDFCMGYGVSILSAILGGAESARHILLHIQPGDPGYGSKALGLSTYTWAFITFVIVIAFCGVMMTFAPWLTPRGVKTHALSAVIMWLFALIVVANLVMIVFLEGFHVLLPGDPACYELVQNCSPR